jgi:hypothetical protein
VRVEDSVLDAEGDVAQLRVVDELGVDARLRLEPRFRRLDALDGGAAKHGGKDVGQQQDRTLKIFIIFYNFFTLPFGLMGQSPKARPFLGRSFRAKKEDNM